MNQNQISKPKILIHCQYVYGLGHFVRTRELAKGLCESFEVFILNGGEEVQDCGVNEGFQIIQLPAIYKEENGDELIPIDSSITLTNCFESRRNIIDEWVNKIVPDIIITEHFPFGLLFEKEAIHMIKTATKVNLKVKIVCSVRDIIESSKGGLHDDYVCDLINKMYDLVLVHGDGAFLPLSKSFPKIDNIIPAVIQTGYVVTPISAENKALDIPIILVSIAGGRLGSELLDVIVDSHKEIEKKQIHKLILFSGAFQQDFDRLKEKVFALQSKEIVLHKFNRKKYLQCLSIASLVISLGGYNSLIESVSAQKQLLVYNREFAGNNEEQDLRIKLFKEAGYLDVITATDLTVPKLAQILSNNIRSQIGRQYRINVNGAQNSRNHLLQLLKGHSVSVYE